MRRSYLAPVLVLIGLLFIGVIPNGLTAQEEPQWTDFRTRSNYTAEELGTALFPPAAPSVLTRGVFLRPPQKCTFGDES